MLRSGARAAREGDRAKSARFTYCRSNRRRVRNACKTTRWPSKRIYFVKVVRRSCLRFRLHPLYNIRDNGSQGTITHPPSSPGHPVLIDKIVKKLFGAPEAPEDRASARRGAQQWISNPWHAVSVIPCPNACQAARQSYRKRFLSSEAPTLPLTGCSSKTCRCRYVHHDDRRRSLRRVVDGLSAKPRWRGSERRESRGRRSTDQR